MAYITKINVKGTTYDIKSSYDDNTAHNFADIYDPAHSGAYNAGDLVVYDGTLYECQTATANPPGNFDASKWDEVTVEEKFKRIQTAVSDPTSSSTATSFIATASQNTQGVISVTKKGLPFSSTTPLADATSGSAGTASTIARGDHVHPKGPATTADSLATARYIDGVSFNGSADIAHYGECATATGTPLKTANCTGFALKDGARIIVKFASANTMSSGTLQLNINNTGAKNVKYNGSNVTSAGQYIIQANSLHEFVYDLSDDCYHAVGTNTISASYITSVLPVTKGGTGSGGDATPFLGDSIIISNASGSALISDNTVSLAEFHALDGVKTDQTIQDQIDAITGGGTDHVRYLNEVPVWVVAGENYHFTNEKVINGYNASTNPNGYKTDVGDLVVGLDMSLGVVTSKTGSEGVYTYEAEYKGILQHLNATYTSNTETLNLIWMTPTPSTVTP